MLTSTRNPRVQDARRLARRRDREESSAFLVEGRTAVLELLRSSLQVRDLFVGPSLGSDREILAAASDRGVEPVLVTPGVIGAIATTESPQDVVAVAGMPPAGMDPIAGTPSLVLVLDAVRDPGNAGTLVRSALAAGADAVVFGSGSVDPWHPKVVRSAAGASFRVTIAGGVDTTEALAVLKERGLTLVAADAGADACVEDLDLSAPVALVLGNEAWGLPEEHREQMDITVGITMPGPAESLNVAVAGSILLFDIVRQRARSGAGLSSTP